MHVSHVSTVGLLRLQTPGRALTRGCAACSYLSMPPTHCRDGRAQSPLQCYFHGSLINFVTIRLTFPSVTFPVSARFPVLYKLDRVNSLNRSVLAQQLAFVFAVRQTWCIANGHLMIKIYRPVTYYCVLTFVV